MLSQEELESLLTDLESDRVERTVSTNDTGKFCKAICAFSNDLPDHRESGYLLIGVNDDGTPSGIEVTDRLLQKLASYRDDGNVQPMPALAVGKRVVGGHDIAVVEVHPSDLTPIRYKGVVYIRVGPTTRRAHGEDERILSERRTARALSFDALPCLECGMDELVGDLFTLTYLPNAVDEETLAENNRSPSEQMDSLRFFSLRTGCATNAGALLFAKDPLRWLPGAYVQFVRYSGVSVADDVESEHRFSGDLLSVLRQLNEWVPAQIRRRPEADSFLHEQQIVDYPNIAVRELVMNAVMHRNYNSNTPIMFNWFTDRIEIQSPGGLYGEAKPENFPGQTAYRNPVVADAMRTLGYVNRFGRGVIRAQTELAGNGNPEAEFTFESTYFLATIWKKQ